MFFDPERNAYIDEETGQLVCYAEDGENEVIRSAMLTHTSVASPETAREKKNKKKHKKHTHSKHTHTHSPVDTHDMEFSFADTYALPPHNSTDIEMATHNPHTQSTQQQTHDIALGEMERDLYNVLVQTNDAPHNTHSENGSGNTAAGSGNSGTAAESDWNFARTLQMLEFEIANEEVDQFDDFSRKEYRASRSCRRQLATVSFLICVVQIALLIAMIQTDGWASSSDNPAVGPPVTSMVRYGAKDAALILYRKEWWRLLSSTMLHAGLYHLIPNVAIQLRVGGYLNLVYGTPAWLWIYIISGIFGEMMSCIFIPDSVGVGSSGALMGMLSSWVVWIIFRWKKIPPECKSQRNCQLGVVIASIVVTLATSFMPRVDWAAHAGGALMGVLWGIILLSSQLDNNRTQLYVRIAAFVAFAIIFAYSLFYMIDKLHPSRELLSYWDSNDDW